LNEFIEGDLKPCSAVQPSQRSQIVVAPSSTMYRHDGNVSCSSSRYAMSVRPAELSTGNS